MGIHRFPDMVARVDRPTIFIISPLDRRWQISLLSDVYPSISSTKLIHQTPAPKNTRPTSLSVTIFVVLCIYFVWLTDVNAFTGRTAFHT
jgi:hypothetical protein